MEMKITTDATTMDGPDGVSKCNERYMPNITAKIPSIDETIAITSGEFATCLAVAAGIINIEVINNSPTILNETATTIVINNIINNWLNKVFKPSDFASFSLIVVKTKDDQLKNKKISTKMPPKIIK